VGNQCAAVGEGGTGRRREGGAGRQGRRRDGTRSEPGVERTLVPALGRPRADDERL